MGFPPSLDEMFRLAAFVVDEVYPSGVIPARAGGAGLIPAHGNELRRVLANGIAPPQPRKDES
jgi:hypothetical protein